VYWSAAVSPGFISICGATPPADAAPAPEGCTPGPPPVSGTAVLLGSSCANFVHASRQPWSVRGYRSVGADGLSRFQIPKKSAP
jgi:hypothetical protein